MRLDDFDFDLPEGLIAIRPVRPRSSARLLVAAGTLLRDLRVSDLPQLLEPGDRLILNNTKVIPARLFGHRLRKSAVEATRAKIEITLLEPAADGGWRALARPLRKLRPGDQIAFAAGMSAEVVLLEETAVVLAFNLDGPEFDSALALAGMMPLPPYIAALRPADAQDSVDYQTVFARHAGAVAAPTASLHFDEDLLVALRQRGVLISEVTLHVGAGTFLPVKVDDVTTHRMHKEWGEVSVEAAAGINATRAAGGRIIAVGTTALRLIETAGESGIVRPWSGTTDIFIYPGYRFRVTDGLMTNFHLPKSTLMMLVSALMGLDEVRAIYAHAIRAGYRFFSYGDASLLFPDAGHGAGWVADEDDKTGPKR